MDVCHLLVFLLAVAVSPSLTPPAFGQGLFRCQETDYGAGRPPNLLQSRYHLVQVFGEVSYRSTNFFADNYRGPVASVEHRLFFPRLSEWVLTPIPLPDPFLIGIAKGLKDLDWENRWDYGAGLEFRPLKRVEIHEGSVLRWMGHLRLYVVYLGTSYLRNREGWSWRPDDDFRAGVELYRECNLYSSGDLARDNILWGEFWADGSWRRTNFFVDDFRSWTFAFVPRVGVRLFPGRELAVMPYVTGELAVTGRTEFWQNRLLAGIGLRVMPFRWQEGAAGVLVRGTRLFMESLWAVHCLKDEPASGTPNRDMRFGLVLTIYRR